MLFGVFVWLAVWTDIPLTEVGLLEVMVIAIAGPVCMSQAMSREAFLPYSYFACPCDEGTISRPCPRSSPWMSLQLVIPGRLLSSRARFRFTSRSYIANHQSRPTMLRQRTAKCRLTGCLSRGVQSREIGCEISVGHDLVWLSEPADRYAFYCWQELVFVIDILCDAHVGNQPKWASVAICML